MNSVRRISVMMLASLALAGCTQIPSPEPSQPWVGPNGKVVQPPPQGWPSYEKGGGADMGGGGRN